MGVLELVFYQFLQGVNKKGYYHLMVQVVSAKLLNGL
jgi:hypothetical protein